MGFHDIARRLIGAHNTSKPHRSSDFYEVGFHGDKYLIEIARSCLGRAEQFIETGANVGSTLAYVAGEFSHLKIYSCEPDQQAFKEAQIHVGTYRHVRLLNLPSPDIFHSLVGMDRDVLGRDTVFWLDAHCYGFDWPLRDEVAFITRQFTKGYIFIDDFKVPGMDCFQYFTDGKGECSFEYIRGSLNLDRPYGLYYPAYQEKTSSHHPLCGWGMIEFGHAQPIALPPGLLTKIRLEHVRGDQGA